MMRQLSDPFGPKGTHTYPGSRMKFNGGCKECGEISNELNNTTRVDMTDKAGKTIELLKVTCNYCGFTKFFDLAVPRKVPHKYAKEVDEVIPQ